MFLCEMRKDLHPIFRSHGPSFCRPAKTCGSSIIFSRSASSGSETVPGDGNPCVSQIHAQVATIAP